MVSRKSVVTGDGTEYPVDAVFDNRAEDVAQFMLAPLVQACEAGLHSCLLLFGTNGQGEVTRRHPAERSFCPARQWQYGSFF